MRRIALGVSMLALALGAGPAAAAPNAPDTASLTQSQQVSYDGKTSVDVPLNASIKRSVNGNVRLRVDGRTNVVTGGKVNARTSVKAKGTTNGTTKGRGKARVETKVNSRTNVKAKGTTTGRVKTRVDAESKHTRDESRFGGWIDRNPSAGNPRWIAGHGNEQTVLGRKGGIGSAAKAENAKLTGRSGYPDVRLGSDDRLHEGGCNEGRARSGIDRLRGAAICPVAAMQMQQPLLAGGAAFLGGFLCLAAGSVLRRRLRL